MRIVAGFLLCAAMAWAEDNTARRLAPEIVWNSKECTLSWKIEEGSVDGKGKFKPLRKVTYTVRLHDRLMTDGKETHEFSPREQSYMEEALNKLITEYALASTAWFVDPKVRQRMEGGDPSPSRPRLESTLLSWRRAP